MDAISHDQIKTIKLKANVKYTKKGKIKVLAKVSKSKKAIEAMKGMGLNVEYKFYRSTKKNGKYKAIITKSKPSFVNTKGKIGKTYQYKATMIFKNDKGEVVGKTSLKQCKMASKKWKKVA